MKTQIILSKVIIFIFMMLLMEKGFTQSTSAGNGNIPIGGGPEYVGWATGMNLPLDIKNEDDQPLMFYTNAGKHAKSITLPCISYY